MRISRHPAPDHRGVRSRQPTRGDSKGRASNRKQPVLAIYGRSSRQRAEAHTRPPGPTTGGSSPGKTAGARLRQQKPAADNGGPRQAAAAKTSSRGARRTAGARDDRRSQRRRATEVDTRQRTRTFLPSRRRRGRQTT